MAAIKSYTDLSQSKILSKILSDESADMVYLYWVKGDSQSGIEEGIDTIPTIREGLPIQKCDIPCWSLSALLNILPDYSLSTNTDGTVSVICESKKPMMPDAYDSPVDACYWMILKLHELKML